MNQKLLITPVITPGGIPDEDTLKKEGFDGELDVAGPEQSTRKVRLRDGAPQDFHRACQKLLASFAGKTDAILVGGTTGEGIGFGLRQWQTLLTAMKKACPPDIRIMAGLLGRDDMIQDQIRIAHRLGIKQFVLGLNHTGENQRRFDNTIGTFATNDEVWLYNMPTFDPAPLEFVRECTKNNHVQGIKDSSKETDALRLRMLLELREHRRNFQVLAGNEKVYGELDTDTFIQINGLVSGNSNARPDLLRSFTDEPQSFASQRKEMEEAMVALSPFGGDGPAARIQRHIHSVKLELMKGGILEPQNVMLYDNRGKLFQTNITL